MKLRDVTNIECQSKRKVCLNFLRAFARKPYINTPKLKGGKQKIFQTRKRFLLKVSSFQTISQFLSILRPFSITFKDFFFYLLRPFEICGLILWMSYHIEMNEIWIWQFQVERSMPGDKEILGGRASYSSKCITWKSLQITSKDAMRPLLLRMASKSACALYA